eukprot:70029_1
MNFARECQKRRWLWKELPTFPFKSFSKPIMVNIEEFIIVPAYTSYYRGDAICKYNLRTCEWNKCIPYNTILISGHTSALRSTSPADCAIFIYTQQHQLSEVDIYNKTWTVHQLKRTLELGYGAKSVFINNEFHIIGGNSNNKHFIWNHQTKELESIYEFTEFAKGLHKFELVYIQKKQILLLFGGMDSMKHQCLNTIYSYCVKSKTWNKLNVKLPISLTDFGIVLTRDSRFVVLFGGRKSEMFTNHSDDIVVYDVQHETIVMCAIKCPHASMFKAVITDHFHNALLLVYGYIRGMDVVKPPADVMDTLHSYYPIESEYIHIIGYSTSTSGRHWRIKVKDILN